MLRYLTWYRGYISLRRVEHRLYLVKRWSHNSPSKVLESSEAMTIIEPTIKEGELESLKIIGDVKSSIHDGVSSHVSFYRRDLPSLLVSFTSEEGKKIFREALDEGYMESYFSLVGNFATQTEPACKF
jgi:hypothetical protein